MRGATLTVMAGGRRSGSLGGPPLSGSDSVEVEGDNLGVVACSPSDDDEANNVELLPLSDEDRIADD